MGEHGEGAGEQILAQGFWGTASPTQGEMQPAPGTRGEPALLDLEHLHYPKKVSQGFRIQTAVRLEGRKEIPFLLDCVCSRESQRCA